MPSGGHPAHFREPQANTAVALGLLRGGDTVIANSLDAGGHNPIGIFGRRIQVRGQVLDTGKPNSISLHFWPTTPDRYHIDAKKSIGLFEQTSPRLVILGKSLFLFPEPVEDIAGICREKNIPVLYDAAHEIAQRLAENNIIVNYNMLPGDRDARNPSGLRIGVQELFFV